MNAKVGWAGLLLGMWLIPSAAGQAPPAPSQGQIHTGQIPEVIAPTEELHVLKVQNLQMRDTLLRQQVAELQRRVMEESQRIEADWKSLEDTLRSALKPPTEYIFDRGKGAFVLPPPPEKKP